MERQAGAVKNKNKNDNSSMIMFLNLLSPTIEYAR